MTDLMKSNVTRVSAERTQSVESCKRLGRAIFANVIGVRCKLQQVRLKLIATPIDA